MKNALKVRDTRMRKIICIGLHRRDQATRSDFLEQSFDTTQRFTIMTTSSHFLPSSPTAQGNNNPTVLELLEHF